MSQRPIQRLASRADTQARLIRHTVPIVEGQGVLRLNEIQEQVGRGEYRVDTQAVADAILRRLLGTQLAAAGPSKRAQSECS
jgi:anti-sigma28 factor (negative regulator of flagellin synthesis)